MAGARYLGRSTSGDGVSYDCFMGEVVECPIGWHQIPSFAFAIKPPTYGPMQPPPGPRYEYGGIISVTDGSPVHSIRDNWLGKLVEFVNYSDIAETVRRLNAGESN